MRKVVGLLLLAAVVLPGPEAGANSSTEVPCADGTCVVSADFRPFGFNLLHQANIFADQPDVLVDPRHPQPQTGPGRIYAPIGEIATDNSVPLDSRASRTGRTRGTAFLIAPCLVLTNYHAVFGEKQAPPTPAEMKRQTATFVVAGRAAVRTTAEVVGKYYDDRNQDYTLLKLEICWGEDPDIGWLQLGPLTPGGTPLDVSMAGHPGDLNRDELWIHDKCRLFPNRNSFARLTSCANTRGASGSPIMLKDGDTLKVAAMIRSERNRTERVLPVFDESHANVAVDIYRVLRHDADAAKVIADDVLRFYREVVKDGDVPEDFNLCGIANLRAEYVLRCADAVNTLSSKAMAAATHDPTLGDDELRSIALPAKANGP